MYEYKYEDSYNYSSLVLVKQSRYSLEETSFSIENIQEILTSTPIIKEPAIPFPQADSFERIINLCELLKRKRTLTDEEITTAYGFDKRQTGYYTNAGRYLGFIEKKIDDGVKYQLTAKGKALFTENHLQRQKVFIAAILSHGVFSKALTLYLKKADTPSKPEVVALMKESNLYNVNSDVTYNRRASTVFGWINWILSLQAE